ncbi:MAG: aminotransferase class III-fold pyridoxal phosphate-dependent enzyme, partial [Candidatus Omnitrophica bacterium]|nr:aminotransferase class III-fold pyridoxal phosphate-dependent enzyme [Candidatus Omnitrophota bacterium]
LKKMENILKAQGKRVCAVVIEPLVMCAAGMLVYPEKYLKGVAGLAQKYGVHLILDEVATGFGRTGKMFALEHVGITPDFICLSKGITSGYLPLGATLTTDKVFSAFYDDYDKLKTFYHGHTFTANPISCVAAGASIELFSKEDSFAKIKDINNQLNLFLDKIRDLPMVGDIRSKGVIGAMELVADKKTKEPFGLNKRVGMEVYRAGLKNGLILRPLGNVVYFFLPICVRSGELNDIFKRAEKVMKKLADDLF